jgi:hypothetical protein
MRQSQTWTLIYSRGAGHQARSRGIDVGAVITKALTAAGLMK